MRILAPTLLATALSAQTPPLLLQTPAVSKTHIVFAYAGDLWTVPRTGGDASRLTAGAGLEGRPVFSPDGTQVLFTGEYDGNVDVFLVPATGGVPRRLTWHPAPDVATAWTPDGKIAFTSARNSSSFAKRLFTMPVGGVFPAEVALPMVEEASYSPDGARVAYNPIFRPTQTWKRYRGGRAGEIWIARLSDASIERIPRRKTADKDPRPDSNDYGPMWVEQRIYFLSDRDGPFTLYSYDTQSKRVEQAVPPAAFDIKSASAGPGAIVYEQLGGIWLYDLKTRKPQRVDIRVAGDMPDVRPRIDRVNNSIFWAALSPTGARAVFEARGEILTVPAEKGDVRNITNTTAAAERQPHWSPDGRRIAYLSDESGEYMLHIRSQDGIGDAQKLKLSDPPTYYYTPTWSPDSKKIAYTDKRLNLWYVDLEKAAPVKVDTDLYDGPRRIREFSWSPDSRWITYTRQLDNTLRAVFAYALEGGQRIQITDGMSDAASPNFDRNGEHLYFTASTDVGLSMAWRDMSAMFRPVTRSIYVAVLRKDLPSPLAPESDEEKPADEKKAEAPKPDAPKPVEGAKPADPAKPAAKPLDVRIDADGIEQRILALPIPARDYSRLLTGKAGILFIQESPFGPGPQVLHKWDMKARKLDRVMDGFTGWTLSENGEKLLYRQPAGRWAIAGTAAAVRPTEGTLRLDGMEVRVDPRAEWPQMFREAWRIQRDFFYDPNLHGLDLAATMRKYEPFLEHVASRGDLNHLFADMMGELTASHLSVGGGSGGGPEVKRVQSGLLGADYAIENGRYRIKHVYTGESWNPELRAPLTQPGVNVTAGEYILAVNGRELRDTDNLYSFFEATAGKSVKLKVGADPTGAGSREVTVVPVANDRELRRLAWIEGNRRKVDQLSGGKLAYVHLPDTAQGGYTSFNRYYFAQVGKHGAVIDERFNGGGLMADYIIDYMRRPLMNFRVTRDGRDYTTPHGAIFGPKVMIINEYAGSGGDAMPWLFRKSKSGLLVGKRTWGGLVGGLGGWPLLMDGGVVSPPSVGFYNPDTTDWEVENFGVGPDVEVEMDPAAWRAGRDLQLEKAVEILMAELKKSPPPVHKRPVFPNYHRRGTSN